MDDEEVEGRRLKEEERRREKRSRADVPAPFTRAAVWTHEESDERERERTVQRI